MTAFDDLPAPQEQLSLELEDRPITHIYVASALTTLDSASREAMARTCDIIDASVVSTSGASGIPWRVHLPVVWSAPRPTDRRSPEDIYLANSDHVARASGLIVVADGGGSLGAGQEFAWALARRLPILVVTTDSSRVSRQIAGTPALLSIQQVSGEDELAEAVSTWVTQWGRSVESRARNDQGERILALRAAQRLHEAFEQSENSIEAIATVAALTPNRVRQLFDPDALFAGSVSELVALSGALGLGAGDALSPVPLPELSPNQRTGLATAADEYEWPPQRLLQLEARARLELARGGVRRLPLTSVQDWVEFARYVTS